MAWISSGLSINSQNGLLSLKKNNIDLERTISVLWWWISHKACSRTLSRKFLRGIFRNLGNAQNDIIVTSKIVLGLSEKSKSKFRLAYLDFHEKFRSKPDLFSSLFVFKHSFCYKNAILFFALFTREKCPK